MYRIKIMKPAKKFIDKLPLKDRQRIVAAIEGLPFQGNIKKLEGSNEKFRLRVGTYRVIYTVDHGELLICIVDAGNRGQIYNKY